MAYEPALAGFLVDQDQLDSEVNFIVAASMGTTAESSTTEINWPKVIFSIIICIIGLVGNTVVIFVIVVLREYKKSVTHWYVLQLAIADSLFLLTLPFKTSEDLNKRWIYDEWMCKAKETVLFLNYYASIMFLMIMSIDRYIAVCHTFSDTLQALRKPISAVIITAVTWVVCLCMCIPVMLYSATVGTHPYCSCSYVFPSEDDAPKNATETCIMQGFEHDLANCTKLLEPTDGGTKYCKVAPDFVNELIKSYIGNFDEFLKNLNNYIPPTTGNGTANVNVTANVNGTSNVNGTGFPIVEASGEIPNITNVVDTTATITSAPVTDLLTTAAQYMMPRAEGIPSKCTYVHAPVGWKWFMGFNFVVMYVLPVIVMVLCYGLIINRLSSSKFRTSSTASATQTNGKKRKNSTRSDKDRRRVTIMCAALVTTFVLLWLPFHVNHLAKMVGINVSIQMVYICENLPVAGSLLAYLNSALNPYLYSFLGSNFKRRWDHAAGSIHRSVKRKTSSISGGIGVRYTKKSHKPGRDGSTSNNTATVMTKIYRGKSEKGGSISETKPSLDSTQALSGNSEVLNPVSTVPTNGIETAEGLPAYEEAQSMELLHP